MANFIFSIGTINKKLLIPLIYIILYICLNIYYIYSGYEIASFYIQNFGLCIGQIMTYFAGRLIRYQSESRLSKIIIKHHKRDYVFLFLVCSFYMLSYIANYYIEDDEEEETDSYRELFINDAIEIIFITIITYIFLKYKYYIHHYISIAIFIILCALIDTLLENFTHTDSSIVLVSIIYVLADSLLYFYLKYLIEHKYYFYMDILFIFGIFNIVSHFISVIITIIVQKANGTNALIIQFFQLYVEHGAAYMIIHFLIGLIIIGIFISILEFLIVDKLTPNHVIIGYEIGKIPSTIIEAEGNNKWILLIISFFQIMSLLFYLEIFEYNFCSLNKNTKKQISMRQDNDLIQRKDSGISFDGYYMPKYLLLQEKEMENLDEQ